MNTVKPLLFLARVHGFRARGRCPRPGMTTFMHFSASCQCSDDIRDISGVPGPADFRRGCTVKTLEGAIEIGKVTKAGIEGDRRNAAVFPSPISQQAMGAHDPAAEDEFRE